MVLPLVDFWAEFSLAGRAEDRSSVTPLKLISDEWAAPLGDAKTFLTDMGARVASAESTESRERVNMVPLTTGLYERYRACEI